jgi:hypothetical protein
MIRAAVSDVSVPVPGGHEEVSVSPQADAPSQDARALHEKLEGTFSSSAPETAVPPLAQPPKSGFETAIAQQAATFHDLNMRLDRLEGGAELADLRETMREICEAISGLALEAERGANDLDEKFKALAHSIHGQFQAERERLDAIDARASTIEAGSDQGLSEIRLNLRRLEEQSHAGSARNEQVLEDIRRELRQQEARIEATGAHGEQSLDEIREQLRRQQERIEAQSAWSDEIAHKANALKGEILSETSAVMRGQFALLEQAENSIADLKDRDLHTDERIEVLTGNLASLDRKIGAQLDGSLKLAERLSETEQTIAQRLAALGDDLAGMDRKIKAQGDRLDDRLRIADKDVALRLATLAENLGGLDRKLQLHGDSAHELTDRLRAAENEMAQASLRQRALAQLHSRLANTLLGAPEV